MARILFWADRLSFCCSGPSLFAFSFKLTVRITHGHTPKKSTPVVLLVCMKSTQRSRFLCESGCKGSASALSHQTNTALFS